MSLPPPLSLTDLFAVETCCSTSLPKDRCLTKNMAKKFQKVLVNLNSFLILVFILILCFFANVVFVND